MFYGATDILADPSIPGQTGFAGSLASEVAMTRRGRVREAEGLKIGPLLDGPPVLPESGDDLFGRLTKRRSRWTRTSGRHPTRLPDVVRIRRRGRSAVLGQRFSNHVCQVERHASLMLGFEPIVTQRLSQFREN